MVEEIGLQIGNLLRHKFTNKIINIEGIAYDLIYCKEMSPTGIHMSAYSPIQLTPEILEKCGLINNKIFPEIEYFTLVDGSLHFEDRYTCVDVKYLHQLQNLYFALTGVELNVQL